MSMPMSIDVRSTFHCYLLYSSSFPVDFTSGLPIGIENGPSIKKEIHQ